MRQISIVENVRRVLTHYGIDDWVDIIIDPDGFPWVPDREAYHYEPSDYDRCYGWPRDPEKFLSWFVKEGWDTDASRFSDMAHGAKVSFREPGNWHPALQVCFHPHKDAYGPYYVEIDLDYSAVTGNVVSVLWHFWEASYNFVTQAKTNQQKISKMLDKRFGADLPEIKYRATVA